MIGLAPLFCGGLFFPFQIQGHEGSTIRDMRKLGVDVGRAASFLLLTGSVQQPSYSSILFLGGVFWIEQLSHRLVAHSRADIRSESYG